MRRRTNENSKKRAILVRSLIYGTLAILMFAAAVSGSQNQHSISLRDISFIAGRPVSMTGFGLVVGLGGTGDGSRLAHTDRTLLATLAHLNIDPQYVAVRTGEVAAVLVQAEFWPGMDIGTATSVNVTALNDASDLSGGRLLPLTLSSRDGRYHGTSSEQSTVFGLPTTRFAPAAGIVERSLVNQSPVFMTDLPERDFILELPGLTSEQIAQLSELINRTFGQIAHAHSGCDIEVNLPESYADYAERASLILQIAAMPVEDVVPTLLVDCQDPYPRVE